MPGKTTRSIAAALSIAPSCVSKWKRRLGETGSLEPGRVGGRKANRRSTIRNRCCNCYSCDNHRNGCYLGTPGSSQLRSLNDALPRALYIEQSGNPFRCYDQLSLMVVRGCDLPYFVVTNLPEMALLQVPPVFPHLSLLALSFSNLSIVPLRSP